MIKVTDQLSEADINNLNIKQLDSGLLKGIRRFVRSLNRIGQGTYGSVYQGVLRIPIIAPNGKKITKGTKVVIKAITHRKGDIIELAVLKRLTVLGCPNVNEIYDVFYDSKTGMLYYILEFISGVDLFRMYKRPLWESVHAYPIEQGEPPAMPESLLIKEYINPLLKGLQCMHHNDIVHRDIKAENVVYDLSKQTSVWIDFGLATMTGYIVNNAVGTLTTMAPEILLSRVDKDVEKGLTIDDWKRADIYSFGCMIHELVCGYEYRPQREMIEKYRKFKTDKAVGDVISKYLDVEPNIPNRYPRVRDMLIGCLQCDPEQRVVPVEL